MSDGMQVPYPADVRERAKAEGKGLYCIDIQPVKGTRITYKGPASARDIRDLEAFTLAMMKRHTRRKSSAP